MQNWGDLMPTNIKKLRQERKWTQLKLALKMGIDQTTVSSWESENKAPSAASLIKLANVFEVSIDYILKQ